MAITPFHHRLQPQAGAAVADAVRHDPLAVPALGQVTDVLRLGGALQAQPPLAIGVAQPQVGRRQRIQPAAAALGCRGGGRREQGSQERQ